MAFVLQFFPHISFQAQAAESCGETLWTGGRRSVLQTPDTFCGGCGTLGHYHRIVQRLSRSPFEVAGLAVPCGSAPFVVDKGWAGQPWKENGENEINCKIETVGVWNLHGPVFAQPLAFARPRLQKFFDICVEIYLFSHRCHNSCYSRSTHSSWTPCNSVALGEIVSSKVLCFHIFWLLITPLHLKSHYFTTASSRLERVTQRDTSKASLTAVNILFLFLPRAPSPFWKQQFTFEFERFVKQAKGVLGCNCTVTARVPVGAGNRSIQLFTEAKWENGFWKQSGIFSYFFSGDVVSSSFLLLVFPREFYLCCKHRVLD